MDTASEIIDEFQWLAKRIYYSAREGMAIALYTLLNDRSDTDVNRLINQVNRTRCVISIVYKCQLIIVTGKY